MADPVSYARDGAVAVLSIANPPVNALSHGVREGLVAGIARANADPLVRAIVIAGTGRSFPAGADIREFGQPPRAPLLPEVCMGIEESAKPVVAALHGMALGGGFEVALAAHARVAVAEAQVGLPEINLGILPGAGGTQRLPRLVGAEPALAMMLSGKPIPAARALDLGAIDALAEGPLLPFAHAHAMALAEAGEAPRRTREVTTGFTDAATYQAHVRATRAAAEANPVPAAAKIVACVEAAQLLPFEAGLAFERAAFEEAMATDASKALRHMFMADRRAAKPGVPPGTRPREIGEVLVVGAGTMGRGIAMALLSAGLPVYLTDRTAEDVQSARDQIAASYDRAVASGRMRKSDQRARLDGLHIGVGLDGIEDADLVIEAVVEDMEVKRALFAELGAVAKPGAILASNTSYLDIDALAAASGRAPDVLGLHFFSPAHRMRLLEIVVGDQTADDTTATGFALAKRLGKQPVRAGVGDGFIGNAVLAAYRQAADLTLLDGASPYQIDAAMRAYGFPLGPYQVLDLAGLDISWARRKRLAPTRDPALRYVGLGDRLCEAGRFGQKAGGGYYLYEGQGRGGTEDPQILAWVAEERAAQGLIAQEISEQEIQERCLAAMMNAGARLLAEGIASQPGDIDVALVHGFGFPRWRGGPMMAADLAGVLHLQNLLRALSAGDGFWTPHPLVHEATKTAAGFGGLGQG